MSTPFWTPSAQQVREAGMTQFREFVNSRYGLHLKDYWDLHAWSIGTSGQMNDFWTALWDWSGVIGEKGPAPVSMSLHRFRYCLLT